MIPIVGFVTVIVAVAAAARRFGLLSPILLVVVGIGVSFVPGVPEVRLEPDVILFGVLPPLLYVAAIETSVPAFRLNIRPILLLAVGHVLFVAAIVGLVLHAILPSVPLAAAFALGAVVAPPDAVAATSVARKIGLPRRVVTILEGESLVNDATALVTLRVALAAATGQALSGWQIAGTAALAVGGGIVVGGIAALVISRLHRIIRAPLLDNSLSLITPFAVYAVAELVHGSGVVAVVLAGLYIGHRWPTLMSAASRLQMEAFWRMVRFLLEGGVFLLVGLQIRAIIIDLHVAAGTVTLATVAVLGVVIVGRFVWVYFATYLPRLSSRVRRREPYPAVRAPTIISWAGMRGVVTLAAAFTLTLPDRDLFVWLAFAVIIGTLVAQGLTLPAFARILRIPGDDPKVDALAEARAQHDASRAGRARLDELADSAPDEVVNRLRELAEYRDNLAWERLGGRRSETPSEAYGRLRRAMLEAERDVFRKARDEGRVPEEVLRDVQREMDLEETMLRRTSDE